MVAVSAYIGSTRGSGVLASACDVLEMSVVRGVGGMCDMCMCWLGWGKWDMCLCFGCGGVGVGGVGESGWEACARVWEGVVVLCVL